MTVKLNKNKPYGETFGLPGVRYTQGGHDFGPEGNLVGEAPKEEAPKEEAPKKPKYNLMGEAKLKGFMKDFDQEFVDVESAKQWLMQNG